MPVATLSRALSPKPARRSDAIPVSTWILFAAVATFVVYAANFLYFFVDDEAIPFVYAQHLLRGHGLVYASVAEGRVEGYSDFLHVLLDTGILAGVHALAWPKIAVFFVGKGWSLATGIATIGTVFVVLRGLPNIRSLGAAVSLLVLALSGPLALWSCSSLETGTFAFLVTLMTLIQLGPTTIAIQHRHRVAGLLAVLVVLERIDGFVYVAIVSMGFLAFSDARERLSILRNILIPAALAIVLYHAWRVWYFREWLPMPVFAKLWFHLDRSAVLVMKLPEQSYLVRFGEMLGLPFLLCFLALVAGAVGMDRRARPIALILAAAILYASAVSDWMFGFRFFVVAMPLIAVLVAFGCSALQERTRWSYAFALAMIGACTLSAYRFEREFASTYRAGSWWRSPSAEVSRYFDQYYAVYEFARANIGERAETAYNQAGFVPFMLEWRNIDTLGICSKFFAKLPLRDVFFTEVGPYLPMTDKPALHARDAYLLYRDVRYVLPGQNSGNAPQTLFGGYFRKMGDVNREGVYERTSRSTTSFRRDATLFLENAIHIGNIRAISLNGQRQNPASWTEQLPFLRNDHGILPLTDGRAEFDIDLLHDVSVSEVFVNGSRADGDIRMTVEMSDGEKSDVVEILAVADESGGRRFVRLIPQRRASRVRLVVQAAASVKAVWLDDVRVSGQSDTLRSYLQTTLHFE